MNIDRFKKDFEELSALGKTKEGMNRPGYLSAMIFTPSKDGESHNPKEYTLMEDIEKGISLFEHVLRDLAREAL